jgi:L-iditol 2-dehydrogenase
MHMPGGFAEYVVAPEYSLIRWPGRVPAEAACLAEPAANGVHVVNLVKHLEPESVVVIGAGPIGLFCQQAFSAMLGLNSITCDMIPERLSQASSLGASTTINPRSENVVKRVLELTNGEGADVVVDAVGGAITKRLSLAMTRPGGATVWIGLHENSVTIDSHEITLSERQIHGSYAASMEELQLALDLIEEGKIDASSWTTRFRLDEGVSAFHRMLEAKGNDKRGKPR